jgi:hypothetical protein
MIEEGEDGGSIVWNGTEGPVSSSALTKQRLLPKSWWLMCRHNLRQGPSITCRQRFLDCGNLMLTLFGANGQRWRQLDGLLCGEYCRVLSLILY